MNIETNSPLVAGIKRARSHQLSSKDDGSDSAPSDKWIRIQNHIFRAEALLIEIFTVTRSTGTQEDGVRLHVTLSIGKKLNVNVANPANLEKAINTIKVGEWDMSYFDHVVVEEA